MKILIVILLPIVLVGCSDLNDQLLGEWNCPLAPKEVKDIRFDVNQSITYFSDQSFTTSFLFTLVDSTDDVLNLKYIARGDWQIKGEVITDIYRQADFEIADNNLDITPYEEQVFLSKIPKNDVNGKKNKNRILEISDKHLIVQGLNSSKAIECQKVK